MLSCGGLNMIVYVVSMGHKFEGSCVVDVFEQEDDARAFILNSGYQYIEECQEFRKLYREYAIIEGFEVTKSKIVDSASSELLEEV